MNTDLIQHLANVVARRGFNAALDATEPARSGAVQLETDVDRTVGQAPIEDAVEMTAEAGESLATPLRRESFSLRGFLRREKVPTGG